MNYDEKSRKMGAKLQFQDYPFLCFLSQSSINIVDLKGKKMEWYEFEVLQ